MNSLPDTQKNLKAALPARGAAFVLHSLLELLPESSPKYNLLITLQAEFRRWQTAVLSGILSEEVKSLKANQLNSRILEFIDGLSPEDFDKNTRRSRITENARIRKGNVLYQIPREMKLEAECRCLVRIAFDKEMLLEALDMTVHTEMREQIRISDYMKVEIVDPSSTPVFRIVARSEPIQLIDEDDYTEWRFLITPLKTGRHVLELKVSIMEHINGEDRVREKTLEESVVIITDPAVDAEPPVWKTDPEALLMPCKVQSIAPQRFNWSGGWRTMALALALLVGVSSVAYAYGPVGLREGVDWAVARYLQDSESAYNAFLEAYPNSARKETAVFRRAKAIQQTDAERTEEAMLAYLEEYGNTAQYADEAWWAVATTTQAPEDYQQYANLQGEQPREAEAKAAIAQLENSLWRDIKAQTTAVQLDRYLRLYPQGSHRSQAISLLADTAYWIPDIRLPERLLRDTAHWRARIKAYAQEADGPTAEQLQRLADKPAVQITEISAAGTTSSEQDAKAAADAAMAVNTIAAYNDYLVGPHRNSQYASDLRRRRDALQKAANYRSALVATIAANMVQVPGGTFTMGCQDGRDTDCFDREKPPHEVTLSTYYISQYEVTQAQWRAVMGSDPPELYNQGCDICPVENVSWNDIQDFLRKLNAQTGQNYRLPTEAEWEYAARGGAGSRGYRYSGGNNLDEVAWYSANAKPGNTHGSQKSTRPVGGKKPNELGLYDMSGNVYEWCSDWYGAYAAGAQTNPKGASSRMNRVYRGGSWGYFPLHCGAAIRNYYLPPFRDSFIGFRLAR